MDVPPKKEKSFLPRVNRYLYWHNEATEIKSNKTRQKCIFIVNNANNKVRKIAMDGKVSKRLLFNHDSFAPITPIETPLAKLCENK